MEDEAGGDIFKVWHGLSQGWCYVGRLMAEENKDNIRTINWHRLVLYR